MNAYWASLNRRQRGLLMLGGGVLVGAALFLLAWEPMVAARDQQRERVAAQQATLDWLEAVAPVAAELRRHGDRERARSDRSLLGLADETARAGGLAGALTRIEPVGEDRVRVWLDDANFLSTMQWLEQLAASHPVTVSQLDLERGRGSGLVNVRVTLVGDA